MVSATAIDLPHTEKYRFAIKLLLNWGERTVASIFGHSDEDSSSTIRKNIGRNCTGEEEKQHVGDTIKTEGFERSRNLICTA